MFQWVPYAFVRIAFFFIAGILTGIYQPIVTEYQAGALLVGLVVVYFLLALWDKLNPGPAGLLAVFMAGYVNVLINTESRHATHFMHTKLTAYEVILTEPAEEKTNSWKQVARVTAIKPQTGEWLPATGNVLLYFSKTGFTKPYGYGHVLLINGAPGEIAPPANPGEFDYKRFLSYRNIFHQHFLRSGSAMHVDSTRGNPVIQLAYTIRERAQQTLHAHISGRQQQAIASALILGVKDGLDNDLTQAYAASGAMHVLAVSGLHVGIIYMIIVFLLQPLTHSRHGKWILAFTSIMLLWGYAMITGYSPSVLRAVTMFSFVALARPLNYRTNIYNILAASAFLLLLVNPYLVMSVGFQLSYLAVIGIVYLQPELYRLWSPKSFIADKVWQITCVSLAAQLATFSLGILYFHQFPVYFLFSNLFVIPCATAILIGGVLLLATSPLSAVSGIIGFALTWLIKALNVVVFTIEQLPFSIVENIYITTPQCWLLILLVLFGILLWRFRKFSFVLAAALMAFLFGLIQWHHYFNEIKPARLVVYNIAGYSAMEITHKGISEFFGNPALLADAERVRFHIRPNRLIGGVYHTSVNDSAAVVAVTPRVNIYQWHNRLVVSLHKPTTLPRNLSADYLIISNNAVTSATELATIQAQAIVLDSSNAPGIAEKLLAEAKSLSLPIYSVLHSGAFVNRISP